jgi:hypothetical protein
MKKFKGGKKWRRALSMLLVLTLVFSLCSVTAFATEEGNDNNTGNNETTVTGTTTTTKTEDTNNDGQAEEGDEEEGEQKEDSNDNEKNDNTGNDDASNEENEQKENSKENSDDSSETVKTKTRATSNSEENLEGEDTNNGDENSDTNVTLSSGVEWSITDNGETLTFSATESGRIIPVYTLVTAPWSTYTSIKKVIFENGIYNVGADMFKYSNNITEIYIFNNNIKLVENSFSGINTATVTYSCSFTGTLPSDSYGATSIKWEIAAHDYNDEGVCKNCGSNADTKEIEDTTTDNKFGDTAKWKIDNGTLTISAIDGTNGELVGVNGNASDYPWYDNKNDITKIVIEKGITKIGAKIFYYLTNVTEIELPNTLTYIESNAFGNTSNNGTQINQASLTVDCAFSESLYGKNYGAVELNWTRNDHILNGDDKCTVCDKEFGGTLSSSSAKWELIKNDDTSYTLKITGSGEVPSYNDKTLPWHDFRESITKIEIGEGITGIGAKVFYYLTNVTEIELPHSLTSIADSSFGNKNNNVTQIAKATVTVDCAFSESLYGNNYGIADATWSRNDHELSENGTKCLVCEKVFGGTFSTNSSASWKVVKDETGYTLKITGTGALPLVYDSTSLDKAPWFGVSELITKIVIENGITEIGNKEFYYLTNVTEIELPSSLTTIGSNIFGNPNSSGTQISKATVTVDCAFLDSLYGNNYGGDSLVWSMNGHVLADDSVICSVCNKTIGGNFANNGQKDVNWVLVKNDTGYTLKITGSGEIPTDESAKLPWYEYRTLITKIVIENGITKIGNKDFYYLTNVTEIELPSSLTSIESNAFGNSANTGSQISGATVYYYNSTVESKNYGGTNLNWIPYVATVGDKAYTSFADAVKAADGDIALVGNASVDSDKTVTLSKDITIDMSSYSIKVNGTLNISAGTFNSSSDNNGFNVAEGGNLVISGGTFSSEPDSAWLKSGYYAFDNENNGTYTVTKGGMLTFTTSGVDENSSIEFTITIGDDEEIASSYDKPVKAGVVVVATAPDIEGKTFEGWYDDTTLLSNDQTYKFRVSKDVIYTAKYVAPTEEVSVTKEPTITMSSYYATNLNGKHALSFIANRNVPDGYTLVEAGMLYATNSKLGISGMASTNLFNKKVNGTAGKTWVYERMTEKEKCYTSSSTKVAKVGDYTLTVSVASDTVVVYAIGYIKVLKDGETEPKIIYSDEVYATYYNE